MRKELILSLALVLILSGCGGLGQDQARQEGLLSPEEAGVEAKNFINNYLIGETQEPVEIMEIEEEMGMYKLIVQSGVQTIESYMSKDGVKFFPQAIDMQEPDQQLTQGQTPQPQGAEQPPMPDMSLEEQAEMMVQESSMLIDEMGGEMDEEERANLEQKVAGLKEINESVDPSSEELEEGILELEEAIYPIIEKIIGQQQTGAVPPQGEEGVSPEVQVVEPDSSGQIDISP